METIDNLQTPAFLVDLDVVERNCRRMLEKASASGAVLRPHVKTHKTIEGAKLQLGAGTGPVTVSTVAEAEFYAEAGFRDITYAVPLAFDKLDRVARLQREIDVLHILVDHPDTLAGAEQFAASHGVTFSAFIKIDSGYHRAGLDPRSPVTLDLARRIEHSPHVSLSGFLTHAGHSYHAHGPEEIAEIAEEERGAVVEFSRRAAAAGISGGVTSIGSTPTISIGKNFEGIDEIRPGNYIFFDAFQAAIGSCGWEDCAATVLTSVLSVHPERRQILIDAGALALSKDLGATHIAGHEPSYGVVISDGKVRKDMKLHSVSQEHGQIEVTSEEFPGDIRIGQKLHIIENHSCLTAAMFDRYHVVRGDRVVDEWRPVRGW